MDCNNSIIHTNIKNKQVHSTQMSSDNSQCYPRVTFITVMQGYIVATVWGQLLYEPQKLTSKYGICITRSSYIIIIKST